MGDSMEPLKVNCQLGWLISTSEIEPGASAVIGSNELAFFVIHYTAVISITLSLLASVIVIAHIYSKWRLHTSKVGFPARFPLYVAISEILWGLCPLADQLYLLVFKTFPENHGIQQAFSMNMCFIFGYQQLVHTSVAIYIYLRVVRQKKLDLGRWEWKLHATLFTFMLGVTVLAQLSGSLGIAGYWMGHDITTIYGKLLAVLAALASTLNALATTLSYRSIRRRVVDDELNLTARVIHLQHRNVRTKESVADESVASQCLTTYVHVSAYYFCPLTLLIWVNVLIPLFVSAIDPLSSLLIGVMANSSGLANAYGYFRNEKLRKGRE